MGNLICIENQMSDVKRNNQQVAENKGDEHTKTNGKSIEGLNCKNVMEKVETTYEGRAFINIRKLDIARIIHLWH